MRVREATTGIRGGFVKALVELHGRRSAGVGCSAGPTMPLWDSQKPRGLVCAGDR